MPAGKSEAALQAEWDADTLTSAAQIQSDPKRFRAAKKIAAKKAKEKQKEAQQLNRLASGRSALADPTKKKAVTKKKTQTRRKR